MVILIKLYKHEYDSRGRWLGIVGCYEEWRI